MNLDIRRGAVEDLKRMEKEVQKQIRDAIEGLKQDPLGDNCSLFRKQGLDLFRLKLKEGELDHRVFYDLVDDKIVVYAVEHRDDAYTPESIEKIKSRS